MMLERLLLQERRAETLRETADIPGVEPLNVDVKKALAEKDIINKMYSMSVPTYTPPKVLKIPPGFERVELKSPFKALFEVYSSPGHDEVIIDGVRYRRLKSIDASREPIVDTFYLLKFYDGVWDYYVPAGPEYEKYFENEEYVTSTHYLIDWDNGVIIDYPMGSITSGENFSNPRTIRTLVLASKILPEFREIGNAYFSGELNEKAAEKIYNKIKHLMAEKEIEKEIVKIHIIEDP